MCLAMYASGTRDHQQRDWWPYQHEDKPLLPPPTRMLLSNSFPSSHSGQPNLQNTYQDIPTFIQSQIPPERTVFEDRFHRLTTNPSISTLLQIDQKSVQHIPSMISSQLLQHSANYNESSSNLLVTQNPVVINSPFMPTHSLSASPTHPTQTNNTNVTKVNDTTRWQLGVQMNSNALILNSMNNVQLPSFLPTTFQEPAVPSRDSAMSIPKPLPPKTTHFGSDEQTVLEQLLNLRSTGPQKEKRKRSTEVESSNTSKAPKKQQKVKDAKVVAVASNSMFKLVQEPLEVQRKAYKHENRCLHPNPLMVCLRDEFKDMKDKIHGSISVMLVSQQGEEQEQRLNCLESMYGGLKHSITAEGSTEFALKVKQTSGGRVFKLKFTVTYKLPGTSQEVQEIVYSRPFGVYSNKHNRTSRQSQTQTENSNQNSENSESEHSNTSHTGNNTPEFCSAS